MSLAVFTDSTTAQASPAFTRRPGAGSSTKTTSVNSCWAWSVIPTVAVSPARRTHSWVWAYLRSGGTFELIHDFFQDGEISQQSGEPAKEKNSSNHPALRDSPAPGLGIAPLKGSQAFR